MDAPFDLAEVKLSSPSLRPGTVAKGDVIAELCASDAPLVTVVAPPGYGKTTFLARWAEADPRAFAWIALDKRDDDPVVLIRHIAMRTNAVVRSSITAGGNDFSSVALASSSASSWTASLRKCCL